MSPADPASTAAGVAAAHAAPTGDAAMETTAAGARRAPLILFGAFDRHNLGDLLLGRIAAELAARLLPGPGPQQPAQQSPNAGRQAGMHPGQAPNSPRNGSRPVATRPRRGCCRWVARSSTAAPGRRR